MKNISFLLCLIVVLFCSSNLLGNKIEADKIIEFGSRDFLFVFSLTKVNDTCIEVQRFFKNKSNAAAYLPQFGGIIYPDNYLMGIPNEELVIPAGVFVKGAYQEIAPRLDRVKPKDSIVNFTMVICKREYQKIIIEFDCLILALLNEKDQKLLSRNIALLDYEGVSFYTISRQLYGKFSYWLHITSLV